MPTRRLTTVAILIIVSSAASAQQPAKTPPSEENGEGKKTPAENVEFRWLEKTHQDGLTDPTVHRTICPACPANHVSYAHKSTLGVARHMTRLSAHPAVRNRCAVELTMDNSGIDAISDSAAKVKKHTILGVFVGSEFVGVLSQNGRPKNRPVVLLPSPKHVERLYTASNVPRLRTPALLARFRFDGDMKDSSGRDTNVTVKNAVFRENSLYVNGNPARADGALTCQIKTPAMNGIRFAVAMRFKAFRLRDPAYRTILCGGAANCWFHLTSSEGGKLTVNLNNGSFRHTTSVDVNSWEWYTIVCDFDFGARLLHLRVDGKDLEPIQLPPGACRRIADAEKVWSFVHNIRGSAFHGLVDELVVYDGAFWPNKVPDVVIINKSGQASTESAASSDEKPNE